MFISSEQMEINRCYRQDKGGGKKSFSGEVMMSLSGSLLSHLFSEPLHSFCCCPPLGNSQQMSIRLSGSSVCVWLDIHCFELLTDNKAKEGPHSVRYVTPTQTRPTPAMCHRQRARGQNIWLKYSLMFYTQWKAAAVGPLHKSLLQR